MSLQVAAILHTKGFRRLVGGDKHWGKKPPQDMAVWQGNQLRGLLMGSTVTCLLVQKHVELVLLLQVSQSSFTV